VACLRGVGVAVIRSLSAHGVFLLRARKWRLGWFVACFVRQRSLGSQNTVSSTRTRGGSLTLVFWKLRPDARCWPVNRRQADPAPTKTSELHSVFDVLHHHSNALCSPQLWQIPSRYRRLPGSAPCSRPHALSSFSVSTCASTVLQAGVVNVCCPQSTTGRTRQARPLRPCTTSCLASLLGQTESRLRK
jgi:hypothetical protein